MQCTRPLKAYRAEGGRVVFTSREGWSDRPLELRCGQCIGCRIARSQSWALRCVHEAALHERNSFVTLTYRNEDLPKDLSLRVEDLQLFWKRLRKRGLKFRYFACGEYGDTNLRPHYHACLFGQDFAEDRELYNDANGKKLYVSSMLEETWGKGFAPIGSLEYKSAAYVARYVVKKATGVKAVEEYSRVCKDTGEVFEVKPPFVVMSRRPGLGSEWFSRFKSDVYPADHVVVEGREYRPPRFYDELLSEDELKEIRGRRLDKIAGRELESSPDRLKVKEKVLKANVDRMARKV